MAVNFNGDTDNINLSSTNLDVTNAFSFVWWAKCSDTTTDQYMYGRDPSSLASQHAIILGYSNGNFEFYATGYSGTDPRNDSQLAVPDANYNFYAYTYDGSTWSGYVNGTQVFSVSRTFSLADTSITTRCRLASAAKGGSYFKNTLGEFTVYDAGLTQEQVLSLFNSRLKRHCLQIAKSNLLMYLPLDDLPDGHTGINNDVFKDLSGNGNDGTGVDADDDSTSVAETVLSYPQEICYVDAQAVAGTLSKSLSETISMSDNTSPLLTKLLKTVYDNITVSDYSNPLIVALLKSIYDSITVTDYVDKNVTAGLLEKLLFDNIATTDDVSPLLTKLIAVIYDNVTVADDVTPLIKQLTQSLFDQVAVSDNVEGLLPLLVKSISDTVNVTDNVDGGFAVGRTGFKFEDDVIKVYVKGVEVARFKANGDIDVNGVANDNAF